MGRIIPKWIRKPAKTADQRGLVHGYRSGLEGKNAEHLKALGVDVLFETFKVPYLVPEKRHMYTPDFMLPNFIIVETKGIFDATDRAKHLFVKEQYGDLLDIRFVFTRSKAPIGPGAKTTLAEWCERYGYKYSDKLVPKEWLAESGPKDDPRDVIKKGPWSHVKRIG